MKLENYKTTDSNFWTGRIDDPQDADSFRVHQVIHLIDLHHLDDCKIQANRINICFIGYCSDEGIRRNLGRTGAENGPLDIRKELSNLPASFQEQAVLFDAGNVYCSGTDMEQAQKQLSLAVKAILELGLFPIVLGGGHELAFGHYNGINSFLKNTKKNLGIINFDAHFDLRPFEKQGTSGTMFSQISEHCLSEHQNFNYLCVGVQTSANTKSLFKKADGLGVEYILAKDISDINHQRNANKIKDFIAQNDHIYLTICSDVFNSAFAPGVSSLQPFGLNPEQAVVFIKSILNSNKVISFDIAEVSPRFDHDNRTAKLAAILIYAVINTLSEL